MDYEAFRKEYETQHPASVPVAPSDVGSEYPRWLRGAVLLMFICAALLSGVHTVPTVHASIESGGVVAPLVRDSVALSAFVAVELAIFVAAYARLRGNQRIVTLMLIVVFTIALVSNVNSVLKALAANGDLWVTMVGVILGFGAPLIALMSGEMFVHMHSAGKEADRAAWTAYREERRAFDAVVLSAFRKAHPRVDGHMSAVRPQADTPDGQGHGYGQGYTRRTDAQERVRMHLIDSPEDASLTVRELADKLKVGKTTVADVLKEMRQQRVNGNGNGQHREEQS